MGRAAGLVCAGLLVDGHPTPTDLGRRWSGGDRHRAPRWASQPQQINMVSSRRWVCWGSAMALGMGPRLDAAWRWVGRGNILLGVGVRATQKLRMYRYARGQRQQHEGDLGNAGAGSRFPTSGPEPDPLHKGIWRCDERVDVIPFLHTLRMLSPFQSEIQLRPSEGPWPLSVTGRQADLEAQPNPYRAVLQISLEVGSSSVSSARHGRCKRNKLLMGSGKVHESADETVIWRWRCSAGS